MEVEVVGHDDCSDHGHRLEPLVRIAVLAPGDEHPRKEAALEEEDEKGIWGNLQPGE